MHRPITIGVLTPFLGGHYYSDIVRAVQCTAKKLGINIIFIKTGGKCFDVPIAMDHVDGWLIINYAVEDYYLRQIEEKYRKPIVSIAKDVQRLNMNAGMVVADNEQAAEEAVAHLYEHGHRRIGFLGNLNMDDMKSRFNGYLSAMNKLQLDINKNYIYDYGEITVFGGRKAAQKIIAERFPITAAVVCSDLCAYGMIEAFTEHGYAVPEQFALVSFDNSPIARNCKVPITSIEQNVDVLTERALKNLLLRIEMPQDFAIEKILCQLHKRDSCGCLTSDHSETKGSNITDVNLQPQNYSKATDQNVTYEYNKYVFGNQFKKLEDLTAILESFLNWGCVSRQNGYDAQNLPKLMITEYYQFTKREHISAELMQFPNGRLQAFPPQTSNILVEEQQITYIVPFRMLHNNWSLLAFGTSYKKAEQGLNEGLRLIHLFDMIAIVFDRLALSEESSQLAQQHHQINIRQEVLNRLTEELFFEIDFEKKELWFNQNIKCTVQQSLLLGLEEYIHPEDVSSLYNRYMEHMQNDKPFYIELRVKAPQDNYVKSIIKAESTRDGVGNVVRLIGTVRNASKYGRVKKHGEQDERMSSMFNRKHFNEVVKQKLENETQKFAVCVLNLDNFKIINDSYGHQIGDDIIELVTHILMMNIKTMDHISSFGGDEFVILFQYEEEYQLDEFTTTVTDTINKQILELYNEINMTVSIGISLFPYDGREYDTLLKKADLALFHVKHNGKNNILKFESYMINFQQDKRKIERKLREGLARNHFRLVYQPQMDAKTQKLYGVEALLRMQLSDGSMLSPDRFIPVAESVGLIVPLGEWVLREACKQGVAWIKQGYQPIKISINISRYQLKSIQFISTVRRILEETEMNPAYLTFEITETTIIDQSYIVLDVIEELRALGITVAIDDFGVSYSSLSVLKNFPIEMLKIDQSFVREMNDSEKSYKIIKAIINIAKSLDLRIVAEGVEELSQWNMLEQLGCHYIQGYYISKPVNTLEIVSFFANKVADAELHITKE